MYNPLLKESDIITPTPNGWRGKKNHTWSTDKELKAHIIADCKEAGYSVSVRFRRGGYTTSATITIRADASDFAPDIDEDDLMCLTTYSCCMTDTGMRRCLTDKGYRKYQEIKGIVTSYNRDEGDIMTDYFDRDIYDNYTFKIA